MLPEKVNVQILRCAAQCVGPPRQLCFCCCFSLLSLPPCPDDAASGHSSSTVRRILKRSSLAPVTVTLEQRRAETGGALKAREVLAACIVWRPTRSRAMPLRRLSLRSRQVMLTSLLNSARPKVERPSLGYIVTSIAASY